jgi:hypothetical protein
MDNAPRNSNLKWKVDGNNKSGKAILRLETFCAFAENSFVWQKKIL